MLINIGKGNQSSYTSFLLHVHVNPYIQLYTWLSLAEHVLLSKNFICCPPYTHRDYGLKYMYTIAIHTTSAFLTRLLWCIDESTISAARSSCNAHNICVQCQYVTTSQYLNHKSTSLLHNRHTLEKKCYLRYL